jgi:hypothetical protein
VPIRGIFAGATAVTGSAHKAGELPKVVSVASAVIFEIKKRVRLFICHPTRVSSYCLKFAESYTSMIEFDDRI